MIFVTAADITTEAWREAGWSVSSWGSSGWNMSSLDNMLTHVRY